MSLAKFAGYARVISALEDLSDSLTASGSGVVVGSNVEYAPHQEWGSQHQSGTPHVRPAVRAVGGNLSQIAANADDVDDLLLLLGLALEGEIKRRAPVDTGNLRSSYRTVKL